MTLSGALSGVEHFSVADGGSVQLSTTGNTKGSAAGVFSFTTLDIDGRDASSGDPSATVTITDDVTLIADVATIAQGTMYVSGAARFNVSTLLNVTSDGLSSGDGRTTYASTTGPGTPSTSGCSWYTGDYSRDRAASYGGIGGRASAGCLYGSTFFPSDVGSSGNGGRGGAALRGSRFSAEAGRGREVGRLCGSGAGAEGRPKVAPARRSRLVGAADGGHVIQASGPLSRIFILI